MQFKKLISERRKELERDWENQIQNAYDRLPSWYWDRNQKRQRMDEWVNAQLVKEGFR